VVFFAGPRREGWSRPCGLNKESNQFERCATIPQGSRQTRWSYYGQNICVRFPWPFRQMPMDPVKRFGENRIAFNIPGKVTARKDRLARRRGAKRTR
jgi:hypothetical protein